MKYFSLLEPPTKEAIKRFADKNNLTSHLPESYQHPQEDYLIVSNSPPIFVVADGVTLNFKEIIKNNSRYPNPSPSGAVAKIFCGAVVKNARNGYDSFDVEKVTEIFKEANSEVNQYNQAIGKTDISGNVTGLYAATGSFVVIKESRAHWVAICDSFVAHLDKNLNLQFMSSGSCAPYAVINGEERMVEYLETGVFDLERGDYVFLFTDGFEEYVKLPEFISLFGDWSEGLEERVKQFTATKAEENPEKFGHERSIIVVKF